MDRSRTLLSLALSPLAAFRQAWETRRPYQTVSWVVGAALMLSGLFHLGVFLVDGGAWEGPISWRKPVTFGLSFGITAVTLAWIAGLLRYRRYLAAAALAVSIGSLLEVVLVTMQKWRGVPSHFNDASPFDATVFSLMGLTVAVIAAGIPVITIAAFRPFDAGPAMVVAVQASLQTFQGRAPFDLAPVTGGVLLLSVAVGALAIFGLLAGSFAAKPRDSAV